jgi:hypothetical protein
MSEGPNDAEASPLRSLGLSKTQYAEALLPLPPRQVVEIVKARMRTAKSVNDEIADFFHERIAIEEAYVKSLQKLHRRLPIPGMTPLKYFPSGIATDVKII